MKRLLLILLLLLTGAAYAQLPQLPLLWVDNNECNTNYTYELTFPGTWVGSTPPSWPTTLPYANTHAGVQQAILDVESYRTSTTGHPGTRLDIPAGFLYSDTMGPYIPQTSTVVATHCLVIASTRDAFLPNGRTVCSHGIQDNNPLSTDPGMDNPDCTGTPVSGVNMYYQLGDRAHGATLTTVTPGAFTLQNGTAANTSDYNDVQHMWTVECTAVSCAGLRFCSPVGGGATSSAVPACGSGTLAPDHWLIMDTEFRPKAVFVSSGLGSNPVLMQGSGSETSASQFPHNIHFRKDWSHSDWPTLAAGLNGIRNGFYLTGSYISLVDSQVSESLFPGSESHSVLAQGVGPYKINHNWLEGSSIGVFTGGLCNGTWPNPTYIPFQDVELRRNHIGYPYSWLGVSITGNAHWSGSKGRKNAFELKNGKRILIDGNIIGEVDSSGGQNGTLGDINVRNDSCGAGTNYNLTIQDVRLSNSVFRNSCENWELDNSGPVGAGGGNGRTYGNYRIGFINDLSYNMSASNGAGCSGVSNRGLVFSNGGIEWQGTISGNGTTATFTATCSSSEGKCVGQVASIAINSPGTGCTGNGNFAVSAPNISGGAQASGSYTCSAGALATVTLGGKGSGYTSAPTYTPATGTGTVTVTMNSSSTAPGTGYQALDMLIGDPVAITRCNSTTAFNNVTTTSINGHTIPNQRGPLATTGSTPWNGTPSADNLTVSYPSTVSGSDNGGFCALNVEQGGPSGLTLQHITEVNDTLGYSIGSNASPSSGYNFSTNAAIVDSLLLGAGLGQSALAEGTQSTGFLYDKFTLSMHHVVFPTRTAANYTEYGNNSNFLDSAGCTGVGCHNPVTLYFPATPWAIAGTCSTANVCFMGSEYKNTTLLVLAPADYHDLKLDPSSVFHSGGAQQASDGKDMGADISAIDAAQTLNKYVCGTACGSGPFADVPLSGITSTSVFPIVP